MDEAKYSVTRIRTSTLERIRELADKNDVSTPQMIDLIVRDYDTIKNLVNSWNEYRELVKSANANEEKV